MGRFDAGGIPKAVRLDEPVQQERGSIARNRAVETLAGYFQLEPLAPPERVSRIEKRVQIFMVAARVIRAEKIQSAANPDKFEVLMDHAVFFAIRDIERGIAGSR